MPRVGRRSSGRKKALTKDNRKLAEQSPAVASHSTTLNINALAQITQYRGALVPASALREYEDLVPGAANRVFSLLEDQARHRMSLEKSVITSSIGHERLGILCGLAIALVGIGGAIFLIHDGKSLE